MTDNIEPPRDYIFGELDQPENAAVWMKKRLSGVHHYSQKVPNAPSPGDAVILKVTTDSGQPVDEIFVWYTTDEWQTTQKMPFEKRIYSGTVLPGLISRNGKHHYPSSRGGNGAL